MEPLRPGTAPDLPDHLTPAQIGPAFVNAFQNDLSWVAAVLGAIFLLMFALPRRPVRPGEEPEVGTGTDMSDDADDAEGAVGGEEPAWAAGLTV
ncbi:hypothetical protein [Streptomyces sp. NPDC094437]|uniref:hypothetical protein n=1 Tax=Streptomyces sp. NPDC094437 TaxID=3366060 RepID=UPI003819724A